MTEKVAIADSDTMAVNAVTQKITVSSLSPTNVTEGAVVTISGTNLPTSASGMTIYFQNIQAKIQSIQPGEIKVLVPKTSSGVVTFKLNGKVISSSTGLKFTYYTLTVVKQSVELLTQHDIDAFVKAHKEQRLKINGSFTLGSDYYKNNISSLAGLNNMITSVTGGLILNKIEIQSAAFLNTITSIHGLSVNFCGFKSLTLNGLESFSGDIHLSSLPNLTTVQIQNLINVGDLDIFNCPRASLSFLSSIKTAGLIQLMFISNKQAIRMDNLTTANGLKIVSVDCSLISFKSLTKLTGRLTIWTVSNASQFNFNSLKTVTDRLLIRNTTIADMTGFVALQTVGAFNITENLLLSTLHGLEHLTTFNWPAILGTYHSVSIDFSYNGVTGLAAVFGGLTIQANPKLLSLDGLQNVKVLSFSYISDNKLLNDFCSFKGPILKLQGMPPYTYDIYNEKEDEYTGETGTVNAVNIYNNGKFTSVAENLKAVKNCH